MQFHIEIDENKIDKWVSDEDEQWEFSKQYSSVQDKSQILNGVDRHLAKHQRTANNIYRYWLKTTEWSNLIKY